MTPPPVSPGDLFAFYGLLKQGASGMPDHIDLEAAGAFEGSCRFRAAMYDLGGFPGVVAGNTLCHGVVWRVGDTSVIAALDEFEDVDPVNPAASLYVRARTPLLDDTGAPTGETAHLYWYNRPVTGYPEITDGNWPLERGRARKSG